MGHPNKPGIPPDLLQKWQRIVDLLARVLVVPAGLVMELDGSCLKVCVASAGDENPYEEGELADLNTGLYCDWIKITMKKRFSIEICWKNAKALLKTTCGICSKSLEEIVWSSS